MIWRLVSREVEVSPVPAKSIADLELDDKVYKPDFESSSKFHVFSKDLCRISFLGLGLFGLLIKLGVENPKLMHALREQKYYGMAGIICFALCAASSLFHIFLTSKCLIYQINISRHLGRLDGDRWDEQNKNLSREYIRRQQQDQKRVLHWASILLFTATITLTLGGALVALCGARVLLAAPHSCGVATEQSE